MILQVSPDGKQFVTTSPDRRIRVFWFETGKLRRTYDESLEVKLRLIIIYNAVFKQPEIYNILAGRKVKNYSSGLKVKK